MTEKHRQELDAASMKRRTFLRHAAASLPLACVASTAFAEEASLEKAATDAAQPFPGVITRQTQPLNAEFPFPTLKSFLTPNEQFYIRSHFDVPDVDANRWQLTVEGHVERPFRVGYDELRKMTSQKMTALLECSGNSRVFLPPPQLGIRWEQGAVSNAEWTGVPLSALLERAGVKPGAVEVILEGADRGKFVEPNPKTPGEIHFARSLPLEKARQPEVFLAYQMNGEDLSPEHGYPVRAVVAGWYGMASVKWLERIIVTDRPFQGYFQSFTYTIWERRPDGNATLVPVTETFVKSQIARPMLHETIRAGSTYPIFGAAWSGRPTIAKVEISTDGGKTWPATAKLDSRSVPFAWRFFEHEWHVPSQPGKYTLMARANDEKGNVQPLNRDPDRRDAAITHVQPIDVYVK